MGQCHELFRHADHAAAQQPAGLREVQTGYVHDRVEGGVERVAQRQAAPLEGAHRVLRDGDQVVAAGDAEDALDVVQEGVDVGAGVELCPARRCRCRCASTRTPAGGTRGTC